MTARETSTVRVELGARSYPIWIGHGLLAAPEIFRGLTPSGACVIVSNDTVQPLYAGRLSATLAGLGLRVETIVLPDGESYKEWSTWQRIFDALIAARADRATTIFALGGGVIGDLAGFAAACFMRGVPYVQVPTTLLAQVDSSVGGKTAINHPLGKNLIGAFYQPSAVIADVDTLDTLPERELVSGLAEVIKYGAVADDVFLEWIESNLPALLARDKTALAHAVRRSCEIKAAIVAADERDCGARATLNFGHTFAHAIETGLGYGVWLHGEAVGCGMVMAADLSARLGLIDRSYAERIARIVGRAGLPLRAPPIDAARFVELMHGDKKASAGELYFIVLEAPARAALRRVEAEVVLETIRSNRDG